MDNLAGLKKKLAAAQNEKNVISQDAAESQLAALLGYYDCDPFSGLYSEPQSSGATQQILHDIVRYLRQGRLSIDAADPSAISITQTLMSPIGGESTESKRISEITYAPPTPDIVTKISALSTDLPPIERSERIIGLISRLGLPVMQTLAVQDRQVMQRLGVFFALAL